MSAATLAYLAGETGPTEVVDPTEAVRLTLRYHPESAWKVWTAWRDEVPLNAEWATILFRQTIGFSPELVQHWAATQPHALASVLERWESLPPHSERFRLVARWLAEVEHPSVRRALGLE